MLQRVLSPLVSAVVLVAACAGCHDRAQAAASSERSDPSRTRILPPPAPANPAPFYAFRMKRLDGTDAELSSYAGKVLLVVNTASECGYTPQYQGLQALYARYEGRGFAVLGFPSNDFGGQEPGTSQEIAAFCKTTFGVTFPMFEKVKTTGAEAAPLYQLLSSALGPPKWNFHKYLIDKRGGPVEAWPSAVPPDAPEIARSIERELAAP